MDPDPRSGSMVEGQGTKRRRRRSAESRSRRRHHRPWSDGLPPDLLGVIFLNLRCLADRVCFTAVCRGWRSAARGLDPPPRQLPWLLLPSPAAPSFFSLHSGRTRPLYLPEKVRGATFCGSHDGGWVALAFGQWRDYAAVNLLSGATVPLPDRLRTNLPQFYGDHATREHHPMLIRSVTFSADPSTEGCLAAAHVTSAFNLAFWRHGMDRHWIVHGHFMDAIQDIIYHSNELKQGFHVLSNTEDVVVYSPIGGPGAPLAMARSSYEVERRADYTTRQLSRYLVESDGKLLMVLRIPKRGRRFRIFEMNLGTDGSPVSWVELHDYMAGRMLILGRGCSKVFEASHFSNNKLQLGNNICYLDGTGLSGSETAIGMYYYNRKLYRTDRTWRRFPCRFTSQHSPPIWFAP